MMDYLAHSARDGTPEQSYREHAENVERDALRYAFEAAKYAKSDARLLLAAVRNAAQIHDLGKLNADNQEVLHKADSCSSLPVNHVDAGVALLKCTEEKTMFSQMIIYSHHIGLPDLYEECQRGDAVFRDFNIREMTDAELPGLRMLHGKLMSAQKICSETANQEDFSVLSRLMLSCLADADHSDTARHYGKYPTTEEMPELLPGKRLTALDEYVKKLGGTGERNRLRVEMYEACKNSNVSESIVYCDSPVGSGKTTAVMAYLLREAAKREARRIFVVLPYTNIIRQSVKTYREALTLDGEDPESVVAELHHLADFEHEEVRNLSAQWKAPIIVTTAVAFFETLASNRPATLRRLHELPGSVIFVDEAHAAVPVRLLPITWHWMETYADDWNCKWILASGSLVKFWEMDEIAEKKREVPSILPVEMQKKLLAYEHQRIDFRFEELPLSCGELLDKVLSEPGPRLVIMNTVKNAALIAKQLSERCGRERVMHLSTALTAEDREKTVEAVSERLKNKKDNDWTLVATSCVEAGVNFSFQTGFRERASVLSLLQAAGRINRNGEYRDAAIWDFSMQQSDKLTENKMLAASISVMDDFRRANQSFGPQLSTSAIAKELDRLPQDDKRPLLAAEHNGQFPEVQDRYHIIDADTVLVAADEDLKQRIRNGSANWRDIQRKCVSLYRSKTYAFRLEPLCGAVYDWNLGYDSFIGVMKGILEYEAIKKGFLCQ